MGYGYVEEGKRIPQLRLMEDITENININAYINIEKIYNVGLNTNEKRKEKVGHKLPINTKMVFDRYCIDSRIFTFKLKPTKRGMKSHTYDYLTRSTFSFYEKDFRWEDPLNSPVTFFENK